eukprot:7460310-Ditylum_brightwellii.AAC.1
MKQVQKGQDWPSLVNETCDSCSEGCDLDITNLELDMEEIQANLTKARKDIKLAQKHTAEVWDEYLEEMALQQNTQNKKDITIIIKILGIEK